MLVKFEIVKINKEEKEYEVIGKADSKPGAQEWIKNNKHKYPGFELNFVRSGFTPIIEISNVKRKID